MTVKAIYISFASKEELKTWMDLLAERQSPTKVKSSINLPSRTYDMCHVLISSRRRICHNQRGAIIVSRYDSDCHLQFIWGVTNQGYKCKACAFIVHGGCRDDAAHSCAATAELVPTDMRKKII